MKKNYLMAITLLLAVVASFTACKNNAGDAKNGDAKDSTQQETVAQFIYNFEEVPNVNAPALQSFAWAHMGNHVLAVGGRTNGFHTFDDEFSTFPSKRSNTYFYVINLDSATADSMPIPAKYLLQLRSTNMESYQDGNTLYCVGGYGSTCANDAPSCYQTFPNLTAINLPAAMAAIKSHNATALEASITTITDERMRVTGGELRKIGDWFYLVFGQNFNTIYSDNATGIYTQQIRRFQIKNAGTSLEILNYAADTCTWDDSSFHRRDLVVVENHNPDGEHNITVYGGVFTPQANLDYQTPIYITQTDKATGAVNITTDNSFLQMFNQYSAPTFVIHDNEQKVNYTTIFGGITQYYYQDGQLVNGGSNMPFSNYVTTIARKADGSSEEFPQQTPTLPGFIGAEAIFVPVLPYFGTPSSPVFDAAKVKSGDANGVHIGYLYGGINSTAAQSSGPHSTHASHSIYKVYVKLKQ